MPDRLQKRSDFIRLRRGERRVTPAFVLQVLANGTPQTRIGFTVTKKIGNAVTRNRAKRRLRAVAHEAFQGRADDGMDYVLIARSAVLRRPYATLLDDLQRALVGPRP